MKQVKKKQKHKSKGSVRTITKQVKADSFFNFFDPPIVPDDPNAEVDEDTQVGNYPEIFPYSLILHFRLSLRWISRSDTTFVSE